jgi:hypothetical protein
MHIHPDALAPGVTETAVFHATEHAILTTHNGNGPTLLFILGPDDEEQLLEISAVVRHEDILVVHADRARDEYLGLLEALAPIDPGPAPFGHAADGVALGEGVIERLATAAVTGYDVDYLLDRTRPGRPAPMTFGTVVRVGLDPTLSAAIRALASATSSSPTDVIHNAIHEQRRADA